MDSLESKIEIKYHWTCDVETIPEKHKATLKEDAQNQIFNMITQGYYQGELNTDVRFGKDVVPEEHPEEGLAYSGWWHVKYIE